MVVRFILVGIAAGALTGILIATAFNPLFGMLGGWLTGNCVALLAAWGWNWSTLGKEANTYRASVDAEVASGPTSPVSDQRQNSSVLNFPAKRKSGLVAPPEERVSDLDSWATRAQVIRFEGRFDCERMITYARKAVQWPAGTVIVYDMRLVDFNVPLWEIFAAANAHSPVLSIATGKKLGILVPSEAGGMMRLFRLKLGPAAEAARVAQDISGLQAWLSSDAKREIPGISSEHRQSRVL